MNDDVIAKLAKLVEEKVCVSLIAHGYATIDTDDKYTFDNLHINKDIAKKLNINVNHFYEDPEFLKEMIQIFPAGEYRCSANVLKTRIRSFMKKTSIPDITGDEMLTAARTWVSRKDTPFHGHMINFIFKYDNKVFTSRLESVVLELRHDELNTPDIAQNSTFDTSIDDL